MHYNQTVEVSIKSSRKDRADIMSFWPMAIETRQELNDYLIELPNQQDERLNNIIFLHSLAIQDRTLAEIIGMAANYNYYLNYQENY